MDAQSNILTVSQILARENKKLYGARYEQAYKATDRAAKLKITDQIYELRVVRLFPNTDIPTISKPIVGVSGGRRRKDVQLSA